MTSAYDAALNSVAVFERPGTGLVRATGPDAAAFLHAIASQDIKAIAVGEAIPAFFLDHRAKVLHRVLVLRETDSSFLLMTDTDRGPVLFKHLDKFLISEQVELVDVSGDYTHVHVVGPQSTLLLGSTFKAPEYELDLSKHQTVAETVLHHSDTLRLPGYDVFCPNHLAERLCGTLGTVAFGDAAAWDVLRIEAGVPVFGKDFDETRFVLELPNALAGISYTKGCFPGQEPIVMSRDRAGFVNRTLLGVRSETLLEPGAKLLKDGAEVGVVTSACFSPRLQSPMALAYLKRGFQEPGLALDHGVSVLPWPPVRVET